MRKYFLLCSGIGLIIAVIWSMIQMSRPKIGSLGEGGIPPYFWITMVTTICVAIFAIIKAIQLFRRK